MRLDSLRRSKRAFSDERRVYVKTELSEWFGFVSTSELKKANHTDLVRR